MIAEVSLGELPQLLRDLKQRRVINVSHSVCKHLCRDINPWDCLNAMVQTKFPETYGQRAFGIKSLSF